jgi:hypothetical protein
MGKEKFWDKVAKCEHKNHTAYHKSTNCSTPYSSGTEIHCRDCGVYISECECGCCDGMSGWPWSRIMKQNGKN